MNEDDSETEFVRRQLGNAIPPWRDLELKTDLWPRMLRRMDEAPARFGWFESLLAGLIALTFAIVTDLVPVMLYHL